VRQLADVDAYAVSLGPCAVLLSGPQAVLDVLRALEGSARAAEASGYAVPQRVLALMAELRTQLRNQRAATLASIGNAALPPVPEVSTWKPQDELISVAQAATVLGLQPRQVRNLAKAGQLPAHKVGGCWQLELTGVTAAASRRAGAA
jgi:excisionase family DNA binding protein